MSGIVKGGLMGRGDGNGLKTCEIRSCLDSIFWDGSIDALVHFSAILRLWPFHDSSGASVMHPLLMPLLVPEQQVRANELFRALVAGVYLFGAICLEVS